MGWMVQVKFVEGIEGGRVGVFQICFKDCLEESSKNCLVNIRSRFIVNMSKKRKITDKSDSKIPP